MNYPINRTNVKLFKNVMNEVQVFVTDPDRHPVPLLGKTLTFNIVECARHKLVLQRDALVVDEYRGLCKLVLLPSDTSQWDIGFYTYTVLVTREDGTQVLLYTNENYGAAGDLELVAGPLPSPVQSIVIPVADFLVVSEGIPPLDYKATKAVAGAATVGDLSGMHTVVAYMSNYSGKLWIEASLENQPPSSDNDWFDITPDNGITPQMFDGDSYDTLYQLWLVQMIAQPHVPPYPVDWQPSLPVAFTFTGNYKWVRFKILDAVQNHGTFDQIMFRN